MEKIVEIFKSMGVPTCLAFYRELLEKIRNLDVQIETSLTLTVPQPEHWPSSHENAAGYVRTLNNFFVTAGMTALCAVQSEFVTSDAGIECHATFLLKELIENSESVMKEVDAVHST